jgi:hypothetical protein
MVPFTLHGEAVVCGPDGIAIFDALHRHGTVTEAMLYAFDLLELDGEDLRDLPLGAAEKGRGQAAPRHRAERAHRRGRHSPRQRVLSRLRAVPRHRRRIIRNEGAATAGACEPITLF